MRKIVRVAGLEIGVSSFIIWPCYFNRQTHPARIGSKVSRSSSENRNKSVENDLLEGADVAMADDVGI